MGSSTGPLTVGPTTAASTTIGPSIIWEWSLSLVNTPGVTIYSAMLFYVLFSLC